MKKILRLLAVLAGLAICFAQSAPRSAFAQTAPAHAVTLAWTASPDAATTSGLTYSVYRATGACPATAPTSVTATGFSAITTGVTGLTYTDTSVTVGNNYCYFLTAVAGSESSPPSNDAQTPYPIPLAAPTGITLTVK